MTQRSVIFRDYGEDIFRKRGETFRMIADRDLAMEIGAACHLLWAQSLYDDSIATESRCLAVNLGGCELWITSWLDQRGVAYLAAHPDSDHYPDCFELSAIGVDGQVIPQAWIADSQHTFDTTLKGRSRSHEM